MNNKLSICDKKLYQELLYAIIYNVKVNFLKLEYV